MKSKKFPSIKDLEILPPAGVDYALNSLSVNQKILSDILHQISPYSLNKYYDLNSDDFTEQALSVFTKRDDINLCFFKGIRDSLASLIIELDINLVMFPENSYPGNRQVCKFTGVNYLTYEDSSQLDEILRIYDSSRTLVVWEDPGNPIDRGKFNFNSIIKSHVLVDCAYRFPTLDVEENTDLLKYLRKSFYIAFGLSKSVSLPGSSLSILIGLGSISKNTYPIKWDIFQASVATTFFNQQTIDTIYRDVYKKSLIKYRAKENIFILQNIPVLSNCNPCFITIPVEYCSGNTGKKNYPKERLVRLTLS